MHDFTIRLATINDSDDISALWNFFIRTTVTSFESQEKTNSDITNKITKIFRDGYGFWVARSIQNNQLWGFIYYSRFRKNSGYAFTMEHSIYIHPKNIGKGVGRALIEHAHNDAKAKKYASFIASIGSDNISSIDFHEKLGYQKIAHLPKVGYKFNRWLDLVLMQKFI